MEGAGGRRHWRIRRKRNRGSVVEDVGEGAVEAIGCCLVEAVASSAVLLGLLVLPFWVWLR